MTDKHRNGPGAAPQADAGNGLFGRRSLLRAGLGVAGVLGLAPLAVAAERPPGALAPGAGMRGYGAPSRHLADLQRVGLSSQPGTDGSGVTRTPLERLEGTITPNGLFFERHHAGVPDIDPAAHRLLVHGMVRRPLRFSMAALHRYPLLTRTWFLECSGNSAALAAEAAPQRRCGELHGLISQSEFTGVPLALLLDEAGVDAGSAWVVAEGADGALMNRSIPLDKAANAMLVLYQNGEPLRPENGYPLRLLLPGLEGNMSIKWLHRLEVTDRPAMSREETAKYTDLLPDGRARQFTFEMGVKSVITSPSPGLALGAPGLYQISGLAWSGAGRVRRVAVSADGGRSWADAALEAPVQERCLTRFRAAWRWNGAPAVLQSRAEDEAGAVQPARDAWLTANGPHSFYHYNAVQAWAVAADGSVSNVFV